MAVALLVPSPLLGAALWEPVADALQRRGATATVARLTPPVDAVHPWWSHAAAEVAGCARSAGGSVVLVAHSGSGPMVPAFADATREAGVEVVAEVFVDAGLPVAGVSARTAAPPEFVDLLDHLAGDDGLLPPWCEWWGAGVLEDLVPDPVVRRHLEATCWPVPVSLFDEVPPMPSRWPDVPCAYLRCSEAYDGAAATAEREGWPCVRRDGTHLDPVTRPDDVADGVLALAEAVGTELR